MNKRKKHRYLSYKKYSLTDRFGQHILRKFVCDFEGIDMTLSTSVIAPLRALTQDFSIEVTDSELNHIYKLATRVISDFPQKNDEYVHLSRKQTQSIFKISAYPREQKCYLDPGKFGPILGQGAHKRCVAGIDFTRMCKVAVLKRSSKSIHFENQEIIDIHYTQSIHQRLSHRFAHAQDTAFYQGSTKGLPVAKHEQIQPLASGDLLSWLEQNPQASTQDRLHLMHRLACDLQELFRLKICHKDIKPQNILAYGSGRETELKLADFDLSCHEQDGARIEAICGTPAFMPQELLFGRGYVDLEQAQRGDIYALGLTFYRLLNTKAHPMETILIQPGFNRSNYRQIMLKLIRKEQQGRTRLDAEEAYQLITRMIHAAHELRPDISEVIRQLEDMLTPCSRRQSMLPQGVMC